MGSKTLHAVWIQGIFQGMIQVTGLTKAYPDSSTGLFKALDNVSFYANPGEIFGLLGPNGAGKTTALRVLSTVLKPTSGIVRVNGFDVTTHADEVRHSIGFVSSNTAIYDRMTAWEMVEYFGRLYGIAEARLKDRMHEVFEELSMMDYRDIAGGRMSTGMRQKVSIARAIIHDPPVLIFDEASLGLDVIVARALLGIIDRLRDKGKCIIFSTHVMREVERLCDRVGILYRGRILAMGTLQELTEQTQESDFEEMFFSLLQKSDQEHKLAVAEAMRTLNEGGQRS